MNLEAILEKAMKRPLSLNSSEREMLFALRDKNDINRLFDAAYSVKIQNFGHTVAIRGLVEAGNVCAKDCLYCGIRQSNRNVARYSLSADEIVRLATECARSGYGSLVIQSGEIESEEHTCFIEDILKRINPLNLGITLSLGEQSEETYLRWRRAGASRYLLRIETSNPTLYASLHPASHSWKRRVECLRSLRRCDYQVGTGVMCALPGQTLQDLARDVGFFAEIDADMIGMGPFIPHPDTPLNGETLNAAERLMLGLKMIAVTRLYLHDVNIASATALEALAPDGRELGIKAGANVIMPNITDQKYRLKYQLYANKPNIDEKKCGDDIRHRLAALGETITLEQHGDSLHYRRRKQP